MIQKNRPKHTVKVESPKEAKEALDAAETLGLEVRDVQVKGKWEYTEDVDINRSASCQIEKIGRKWFYLEVAGEVIQCKPGRSSLDFLDAGTLKIRFD